jgi:hypothetical protein
MHARRALAGVAIALAASVVAACSAILGIDDLVPPQGGDASMLPGDGGAQDAPASFDSSDGSMAPPAIGEPCIPGDAGPDAGFLPGNCAAPGVCVRYGGMLLCERPCTMDTDCPQTPVNSGTTAEPWNVAHCGNNAPGICTTACNPIAATGFSGCASNLECGWGPSPTNVTFTDCFPPGVLEAGAVCTGTCGPGLICISTPTSMYVCARGCRAGDDADCLGSKGCQSVVFGMGDAGVPSPFGVCCDPSGPMGC